MSTLSQAESPIPGFTFGIAVPIADLEYSIANDPHSSDALSPCCYPSPPDRKRLALQRAQQRSSHPNANGLASRTQASLPPPAAETPVWRDQASESQRTLSTTPITLPTPLTHDEELSRPEPHDQPEEPAAPAITGLPVSQTSLHQESLVAAQVPMEVALFLFEIYFERHYQAHLLFRKDDLIESYKAGNSCRYVILATFAFASLFLHSVPGGILQGEIGIAEVSLADWQVIGQRWAEEASQQALMRADEPCLELVQACQVLALFWLTSSAAIAYRASRLLHFDRVHPGATMLGLTAEEKLGSKCFWACWLTKCASLENSRFYIDCWASVEGRPLPADEDDKAKGPHYCLDKAGTLISSGGNAELSFNSVLIVVQGLWWEVQQFVGLIHGHHGSQSEWASRYCSLDQRLQDLPSHLASCEQDFLTCDPMMTPTPDLARVLSLRSIYELCLVYLYSSVVPALSCRRETPRFSQPMLQQAAEQAYKHSLTITSMVKQYLSSKASTSKLWPIVGYSAYVCAAVQLRRCLAIDSLDQAWYERNETNLQIAVELGKYWMTLQPLHDDMERQFFHARRLMNVRPVALSRCATRSASDRAYSTDDHVIDSPAELSTHIRIYAASNDDIPGAGVQEGQSTADEVILTPPVSNAHAASIPSSGFAGSLISTITDQSSASSDNAFKEGSGDRIPIGNSLELGGDPTWWNQGADILGEIFSYDFFLPGNISSSENIY
ncbi:hypothetical protein FAVG1_04804 [Fusarium avenaceum]|nr:hypothetical protein FAVG1_04804 [Fusarium avenaceum]